MMRMKSVFVWLLIGAGLFAARSAVAQQESDGQTAASAVGRIGERQTREQAAPNSQPLTRIQSRVPTRVQSRIRSRLDRFYDPQANATSPFVVAGEQARTAGRR